MDYESIDRAALIAANKELGVGRYLGDGGEAVFCPFDGLHFRHPDTNEIVADERRLYDTREQAEAATGGSQRRRRVGVTA